jgi:predicted nucleic acid-binding protein
MRVYLDTCCLSRPFDDPSQLRVRQEAAAVIAIVRDIERGRWEWLTSDILLAEVDQRRGGARHRLIDAWLSLAARHIKNGPDIVRRAEALQALGFHRFDALHLAAAESGGADVFLTTDDRLMRGATRHADELGVVVSNPFAWLERLNG